MKNTFFLLLFLVSTAPVFAQLENLTCLDFAKGEFNNINDLNLTLNSTIFRNGNSQTEITNGEENRKIISWHNDCNYSLFFSNKETSKDNIKKFINKNGGITVTIDRIEGKTMFYTTSYFNGKNDVKGQGRLIKISNNTKFK